MVSDAARYAHHLVFRSFCCLLLRVMHGGFGLASCFSESKSLACAHVVPHCRLHFCSMYALRQAVYCIHMSTCGSRMRVKRAILWTRASGRSRGL
jgi:hypothetical protein